MRVLTRSAMVAAMWALGMQCCQVPAWSQEFPLTEKTAGGSVDAARDDSVEYWVEQLGHEHYLRREMASKKLVAAGPAAIDDLADAMRSGDLEVVERASAAIVEIAVACPPRNDGGAYKRLNTLAVQSVGRAASTARDALREVKAHRYAQARQALSVAGISVGVKDIAVGAISQRRMLVQIDENWNGNDEPLQWLEWLDRVDIARVSGLTLTPELMENVAKIPGLRSLAIVDAKVDDAALEPLTKMDRIDTLDIRYARLTDPQGDLIAAMPLRVSLNLMGTGISPEKVEAMRSALPGLQIEYRRGGFMGVMCYDNQLACEISGVQLNSAAERAGLIRGDVIVQINETKVNQFRDLQETINRHIPGDEVEVHYRRGEKIQSAKIQLGKYEEQ
jgi:hypothetical protein